MGTIIRLSTAHAKLRLSKKITIDDVDAAMEILQFALTWDAEPEQKKKPSRRHEESDEDEDEEMTSPQRRKKKKQKKKKRKRSDVMEEVQDEDTNKNKRARRAKRGKSDQVEDSENVKNVTLVLSECFRKRRIGQLNKSDLLTEINKLRRSNGTTGIRSNFEILT